MAKTTEQGLVFVSKKLETGPAMAGLAGPTPMALAYHYFLEV